MSADRVLERFRDHMLGPARFLNVLSCFELGIVDRLERDGALTAAEIADAVGAREAAVEQLLHLSVKEGLVSLDASGRYSVAGYAALAGEDRQRVLAIMKMMKFVMLRQGFHLTESVREGRPVGLQKVYGHEGNLYEAVAEHDELRDSWGTMMDVITSHIDPWFFENVDVPAGARVLDLAGNTGMGAILTYRAKTSPGLRVTTFDLPEKEDECLRNFRDAGVGDHCSFIGGDVFQGVPEGFDIVLIKHFLDMFDRAEVCEILRNTNKALEVGGQVNILVPIYPEDIRDSPAVEFFPVYFLGCTMGRGGPQKLSTYREWLEECGFAVTRAIAQDPATMPPDALAAHGILSATKK